MLTSIPKSSISHNSSPYSFSLSEIDEYGEIRKNDVVEDCVEMSLCTNQSLAMKRKEVKCSCIGCSDPTVTEKVLVVFTLISLFEVVHTI